MYTLQNRVTKFAFNRCNHLTIDVIENEDSLTLHIYNWHTEQTITRQFVNEQNLFTFLDGYVTCEVQRTNVQKL